MGDRAECFYCIRLEDGLEVYGMRRKGRGVVCKGYLSMLTSVDDLIEVFERIHREAVALRGKGIG